MCGIAALSVIKKLCFLKDEKKNRIEPHNRWNFL